MIRILVIIFCFGLVKSSLCQTFVIQPISHEIHQKMLSQGTLTAASPVSIDRLTLLNITHFNFDGIEKKGQIIVLDVVAKDVLEIFKELYALKFPIHQVKLINEYGGNDDESMADNNTSGHNFRPVAGSTRYSLHSYGTAIDINPVQNPYIIFDEATATAKFLPPNSLPYTNRMLQRLGKDDRVGFAESIVEVFGRHGFYWWGGYWDTPIDYQHFQLDRQVSYILAEMDRNEGEVFFNQLKAHFSKTGKPLEAIAKKDLDTGVSLFEYYSENPEQFLGWIKQFN